MNLWNLKVLGKVGWYLVYDSSEFYWVSKKGHYLADPGTSEYVGALKKTRISPKIKSYCRQNLGLTSGPQKFLRDHFEISFLKCSSNAVWKRLYKLNKYCSCCTSGNNQAMFNVKISTRIVFGKKWRWL